MKSPFEAMARLLDQLVIRNSLFYNKKPGEIIERSNNKMRNLLKKLTSGDLIKLRFEKDLLSLNQRAVERYHELELKKKFDKSLK